MLTTVLWCCRFALHRSIVNGWSIVWRGSIMVSLSEVTMTSIELYSSGAGLRARALLARGGACMR